MPAMQQAPNDIIGDYVIVIIVNILLYDQYYSIRNTLILISLDVFT